MAELFVESDRPSHDLACSLSIVTLMRAVCCTVPKGAPLRLSND